MALEQSPQNPVGAAGQPSWVAPVKPVVPDHQLLVRIGGGSYGDVWLARSVVGTWRAVKVVFRDRFLDSRPYEREFAGIQKFEPLSRSNEGFIDVLQIGRNDAEGYFYYVMELADDASGAQEIRPETYVPKTLAKALLQRGRLPVGDCLELGITLNLALTRLHEAGLIHRDIKPSNIIFVGGIPKLADIGLVIEVAEARSYVGTEGFIPPEGPNSPQADLYSLGKVLYEAGMGKDRKDFPEPLTLIGQAPEATELLEFNAILLKACAANLEDRYQSAGEMNADLALLQSGGSVRRQRTLARRFRSVQRAGALVTLLALVIAAGWFWQAREARKMKRLATEARDNLYAADISAAQHAVEANNLRQALDLLQRHIPQPGEPDLRGFEWRYLWRECQGGQLINLAGHQGIATSVSFSPDGRTLATASYDKTIRIWDLATHRAVATLAADTDGVYSVSFSPRGQVLATASRTSVRVWDPRTFQTLRALPGAIQKAKFSPAGDYLLTGSTNGLILWDTLSWTALKTREVKGLARWTSEYSGGASVDTGWAFSSEGNRVAAICDEGIRLWSIPDFKEVGVLEDRMPRIRFVAFSPDGYTLAACAPGDTHVKLWDLRAQKALKLLSGHSGIVAATAFSPDGKRLVTGSLDQTIKLWDVATGDLLRTFKGHAHEVWDVAFSPDGNLLASVSKDGAVKIWDAWSNPSREAVIGGPSPLGFRADGCLIAAMRTNNTLAALDPESLQIASAQHFYGFSEKVPEIYSVVFGDLFRDGRTAAFHVRSPAEDPHPKEWVELWDLSRDELLGSVPVVGAPVIFAPNRKLLAVCASNQMVALYQFPNAIRTAVITNASQPAAFSPDGTMLATWRATPGGNFGTPIDLWATTKKGVHLLATVHGNGSNGPRAAEFSPDGRTLATDTEDAQIRLWEVPSGRPIGTLTGHKNGGIRLAYGPDGRTLASLAGDGTVRLWHIATGRELMSFQMAGSEFVDRNLKFSPDGCSLAASWWEGPGLRRTQLWHVPPLSEIADGKDVVHLRIMRPDASH